ncbi:hypothetical protein [Neobacillus sp. PS3-40]|uniref:hypothetical protein n=1 Tax=Neobacillus sp. PS3-40 TaxID=3070679 RepID=UPI0027E0BE6F|nr:hypothetical protein [Neobacillus sp. PS3-40]WML45465.1 hypothetical protein RCG20_06060 [Neobacillus sp. PS3-40]
MKKLMLFTLLAFIILNLSPIYTHAEKYLNEDPLKITKEFLSSNSLLVIPEEPVSTKPVQFYDFNKDGQKEIIITFEIRAKKQPSPSQFGALVLRKGNEGWKKVWEIRTSGVGLQFSGFADITGDGSKEYLFGVTMGAAAGNKLEIFKWDNNSLVKIANIPYHKMELLNNKGVGIAVWRPFIADTCYVDVLKWDGQKLTPDEKLFSKYYPVIEKFHKDKIAKMDTWYYWYTLADAQIKANLFEKAQNSIQKGTTLAKQLSLPDEVKNFEKLSDKLDKKKKSY